MLSHVGGFECCVLLCMNQASIQVVKYMYIEYDLPVLLYKSQHEHQTLLHVSAS